jgi:predicted nucleic acid-binding protein
MKYFADTFAIIEYLKDNPKFTAYFEKHEIITTRLNLMELYYSALQEVGEEMAEKQFTSFLSRAVEIEDSHLKSAAKMRFHHKKNNLSYVDCIGYSIANNERVKFLTGDKEFKEMKNVEWIGK